MLLLLATTVPLLFITYIVIAKYIKYKQNCALLSHLPGEQQVFLPNMCALFPSFLRPFVNGTDTENFEMMFWQDHGQRYFAKHKAELIKLVFSDAPFVASNHPDFAKQFAMMGYKHLSKDGPLANFLNNRLGYNLFSITDEVMWKRHRAILNVAFTDTAMNYVADVTRDCVHRLEQAIEKQPLRIVSLDMTDLTLDAIAKVGFGYDADSANSHASASSLVNSVQDFMGNFAVAGYLPEPFDKLPFGGIGKMNRSIPNILDRIANILEHRKHSKEYHRDLLQMLLDASEKPHQDEQETYPQFTKAELISNCFAFLLAGFDTTSWTLTFALYLLAKHPKVQQRAHAELDKIVPNLQEATFTDFEKFHFIENIMKETQRVYPVAAFLIRTVTKEFEYKGKLIPAGALACPSIVGCHQNPEFWDEPQQFNPDRFDDPATIAKMKQHPFMFCPFGIGHRACIGKRLAQVEGVIALVSILQRYSVELHDSNYKMVVTNSITAKPEQDVYLRFTRRSK